MVKKAAKLLLSLIFFFSLSSSAWSTTHVTGRKIVIDAGHGGTDTGSSECPTMDEKDVNLDIARRLKSKLEAENAIVLMTRDDDNTYSNAERYNAANEFGGEALVSVHLNGSTDHSVNGTLGLYGKRNKDKDFAQTLHISLVNALSGVPDQGVTNFASGVLLKSHMPASIQEAVYISNTTECQFLSDGTGLRQQQIADALYDGLQNWFSQAPGNGGGGGSNEPNCPPNSKNPKCQ